MHTLKDFLCTAIKPVGSTMYIWGGGWNESDDGAGDDAMLIGLNPNWRKFFMKQTSEYDYTKHRFEFGNGLDCSGYVGWVMHNYFIGTDLEKVPFVAKAKDQAELFANKNLGTFTHASGVKNHCPGDIMSSSDHVYIVLGQCLDGSVLLVHSSPPGVRITGTCTSSGSACSDAVHIAKAYMQMYYPIWDEKYRKYSKGLSYLTDYSMFRWNIFNSPYMTDPECLTEKSPLCVLRAIYN